MAGNIYFSWLAGLAGLPQNGYIRRNLWFLIRSRLRVGPSGPALFYYLNGPRLPTRRGSVGSDGRAEARPHPVSYQP